MSDDCRGAADESRSRQGRQCEESGLAYAAVLKKLPFAPVALKPVPVAVRWSMRTAQQLIEGFRK